MRWVAACNSTAMLADWAASVRSAWTWRAPYRSRGFRRDSATTSQPLDAPKCRKAALPTSPVAPATTTFLFAISMVASFLLPQGEEENRLFLIVPERVGELVVISGDEIDIALVLDRRHRRLQRFVEVGERVLLVVGGHFLVGLDLGDLHLDDGFSADIFLGRGIEAREHDADVVDDVVVFVVAGKAVLLGDAFELRGDLGIRLGVVRQLRGDRIHVLLRRQHPL